jgi:hypothetical protein
MAASVLTEILVQECDWPLPAGIYLLGAGSAFLLSAGWCGGWTFGLDLHVAESCCGISL